ncbi:hypothetical protein M407DRAFT_246412 [Tulasnella calospora MUT 4182]|uniref:Uncharacterized protein n=1 Tax=Tulasnella calospora MUT 4182 TaxID=1051891 RepID=A0A0C3Q646_9AGAM|nr:hypothetical protein M407DRAFT_246412 [Tulasnella calospora MUT 4182]
MEYMHWKFKAKLVRQVERFSSNANRSILRLEGKTSRAVCCHGLLLKTRLVGRVNKRVAQIQNGTKEDHEAGRS